jgi:hypothetical protein
MVARPRRHEGLDPRITPIDANIIGAVATHGAATADTVIKKEGQRKLPFNMLDKPAIKSS